MDMHEGPADTAADCGGNANAPRSPADGEGVSELQSRVLRSRRSQPLGSLCIDAPDRPPDWRWQFALQIVFKRKRIPRRMLDSPARRAVSLVAQLSNTRATGIRLSSAYKKAAELACRINRQLRQGSQREAIELYLLSCASLEQTATAVGLPVAAVQVYEELYWNVRDRLTAPDYVHCVLVPFALDKKKPEARLTVEVRRLAFAGGPEVVKSLLQRGEFPTSKPANATEVPRFFRQTVVNVLPTKICLAVSLLDPTHPRDARMLLRHHLASMAFERRSSSKISDPPQSAQETRKAIEAFQKALPKKWRRAQPPVSNQESGASSGGG